MNSSNVDIDYNTCILNIMHKLKKKNKMEFYILYFTVSFTVRFMYFVYNPVFVSLNRNNGNAGKPSGNLCLHAQSTGALVLSLIHI